MNDKQNGVNNPNSSTDTSFKNIIRRLVNSINSMKNIVYSDRGPCIKRDSFKNKSRYLADVSTTRRKLYLFIAPYLPTTIQTK